MQQLKKGEVTDADIVLDPFLGSGATCISANRHNVNSIGIEMNDDYYLLSQKIIEEKTSLVLVDKRGFFYGASDGT